MFHPKQIICLSVLMFLALFSLFLLANKADAFSCATAASGNWSAAGTWYNCGGGSPSTWDTANVTSTVTVDATTTVLAITIDTGGTLQFPTSGTGVTLTINDDGDGSLLTVGAAATAGTLTCRAPASGVNTIRLNSTSSDAAVGIQVESQAATFKKDFINFYHRGLKSTNKTKFYWNLL